MKECVYIVHKHCNRPIVKRNIVEEDRDYYVLEDGTYVHRKTMQSCSELFFTDKKVADTTYRYLKTNPKNVEITPNMTQLQNSCNSTEMASLLMNMCRSLGLERVSQDMIEQWLTSSQYVQPVEEHLLENYDGLCAGQTIWHIDSSKKLLSGTVFKVKKVDGKVSFLSAEFIDDFCGFARSTFGETMFINRDLALAALQTM